jgi:hypothetical protein
VRIEDLERLQQEVTFCFNRFYLAYDRMPFRPTYTLAADLQFLQDFSGDFLALSAGSIFIATRERPRIRGNYIWLRARNSNPIRFSKNAYRCVELGGSVLIPAIQLGFFMGIREFYLYGVDHDFKYEIDESEGDKWRRAAGDDNHFIKNYRSGAKWCPPETSYIERSFEICDRFLRAHGGSVKNATRGGKLEVLERVAFGSLLSPSER